MTRTRRAHLRRRFAALILAASGICALASASLASMRPTLSTEFIVRPGRLHSFEPLTQSEQADADNAAYLASKAWGGSWLTYEWNRRTSTPSNLIGDGVPVDQSRLTTDPEGLARDLIAMRPDLFGGRDVVLALDSVRQGAGKTVVHFQQTYEGIEVLNAKAHVTFHDSGKLFELGSDAFPFIGISTIPVINESQALQYAKSSIGFVEGRDRVSEPAHLAILPVPISETETDFHLCWLIQLRVEEPLGSWVHYVSAESGELFARANKMGLMTDLSGQVLGSWEERGQCDMETDGGIRYHASDGMSYARVTVNDVDYYADVDGYFTIPSSAYSVGDTYEATLDWLDGSQGLRIVNCEDTDPCVESIPLVTGVIGTGHVLGGLEIMMDDGSIISERDSWMTIHRARDYFLEEIHPDFWKLDGIITLRVDDPLGDPDLNGRGCGGFCADNCTAPNSADVTIRITGERASDSCGGGLCTDGGRAAGLVLHELGHAVYTGLTGLTSNVTETGLWEGGNPTVYGLLTLEQPMGRGWTCQSQDDCSLDQFDGSDQSIHELQYPEDMVGNDYDDGRILSGFYWQSREALAPVLDRKKISLTNWTWAVALMVPLTMRDQVLATFIADDDDGNLLNGSPHYDAYATGALRHGFVPPPRIGIVVAHNSPDPMILDSDLNAGSLTLTALGTSFGEDISSATIYYREGGVGSFTSSSMSITPDVGPWFSLEGDIDNLASGDEVEYYIEAVDTGGSTRTNPPTAGLYHEFTVVSSFAPMEEDGGWVANLDGTDDARSGEFVRVIPSGGDTQPSEDHTQDGTQAWLTGTGWYEAGDEEHDVDGGKTSVFSPTYDCHGATSAEILFHYWFYGNQNGGTDDALVLFARSGLSPWTELFRATEMTPEWTRQEIDLVPVLGSDLETVQFKFEALDGGAESLVEAALDDFATMVVFGETTSTPAEEVDLSRTTYFRSPTPNPAEGRSLLRFGLAESGGVEVKVFNAAGELVRTLASGEFEAGNHELEWNLDNNNRRRVPNGIYYARLTTVGFSASRRIVLSR